MNKKGFIGRKLTGYLLIAVLILVVFNTYKMSSLSNRLDALTGGGVQAAKSEIKSVAGSDKVTLVEFSDFECPFCGRAYPVVKQLREEYGSKLEFVYKHFPLSNIHPNAQKAAEASECARDQGKFEEYHNKLFENQQALGVSSLKQYAVEFSLDAAKFNNCLDSGEKASIVKKDQDEGESKGVSGTPTFFINNERLIGAQPYSAIKEVIDRQLSGSAPSAPQTVPSAPVPSLPTGAAAKVSASEDDDPVKGNKDAPVTMIEFSDFQCPFCGRFYSQTLAQIQKDYIDTGKVKFVYRDFPLSSIHPQAQIAAEAGECADDQGKFWEYHNKIFENQALLSEASLKQWAVDLGLDADEFNDCLDSGKQKQEVQKDFNDGSSYGVSGTPAFFINGVMVSGAQPFANFKAVIDKELSS